MVTSFILQKSNPFSGLRNAKRLFVITGLGVPPTPPTPTAPPVFIAPPAQDTIRGGAELLLFSGTTLIDTSFDDNLEGSILNSLLWTDISSGTGRITPFRTGLIAETKFTSGSQAGIESTATWENFDLMVDYDIIVNKKAELPTSPLDFAVLELELDTGEIARVSKSWNKDRAIDDSIGSVISGEAIISGTSHPGGQKAVAETLSGTLRLIRVDNRIFGFVDDKEVIDLGIFPSGTGTIRLVTRNLTNSDTVKVKFKNFKYEAHATIDDQLIDNKEVPFNNRIVGNVPATTLSRLGLRDLKVFGRFGVATSVDSFEYILPPPKTITVSNATLINRATVRFFGDVSIKDE